MSPRGLERDESLDPLAADPCDGPSHSDLRAGEAVLVDKAVEHPLGRVALLAGSGEIVGQPLLDDTGEGIHHRAGARARSTVDRWFSRPRKVFSHRLARPARPPGYLPDRVVPVHLSDHLDVDHPEQLPSSCHCRQRPDSGITTTVQASVGWSTFR